MLPNNSYQNAFFGYYWPAGMNFGDPYGSHLKNDEKKGIGLKNRI